VVHPEKCNYWNGDKDGNKMGDFRPYIRILRHWLRGNWQNATLFEVLELPFRGVLDGSPQSKIDHIEESGRYLRVSIRGVKLPLFYPKEADIGNLHGVIDECMNPRSWHYYEGTGTTIGKDDVVLDCGAAEGLFSLLALERCKRVFIAEPLPEFVESLTLTFSGIQRARLLPFALSKEDGEALLEPAGICSRITTGFAGIRINTRSIDSLFIENAEDVTYIKADVEGHEIDLLKGGTRTIQRNTPKISIATYHNPEHAEWIARFLTRIDPHYRIKMRGICPERGNPVMLHAWVERE
jgi:FkbM family methyltransferase